MGGVYFQVGRAGWYAGVGRARWHKRQAFLTESCRFGPGERASSSEMLEAFNESRRQAGERGVSAKVMAKNMSSKGLMKTRLQVHGVGYVQGYEGVSLVRERGRIEADPLDN